MNVRRTMMCSAPRKWKEGRKGKQAVIAFRNALTMKIMVKESERCDKSSQQTEDG